MELLIEQGTIVNEHRSYRGYIVVREGVIARIGEGDFGGEWRGERIDAQGQLVLPGAIDDQVHFREPGLTAKGDIHTESRAAAAGGVTSCLDMPNTIPPTTSLDLWSEKNKLAAARSLTNYGFWFGATNDNVKAIAALDPKKVCGVKVFMGSSTGNLLVDSARSLAAIFAESPVVVATHCEDEALIRADTARLKAQYGDSATAAIHPLVRSAEACYRSTAAAIELAERYSTRLHVLHLSTARELSLFSSAKLSGKKITNEVCVHHLWFCSDDYASKGNLIKWNPAIKTAADRTGLREGVLGGRVDVVATDHAPHLLAEKQQPYWQAPSGGPLVQHSLVAMLALFTPEVVVEKMCHAPALRFGVQGRGFLREGYAADIAIVDPAARWVVGSENILYKCGWSPFEGVEFTHRVTHTLVNGRLVYRHGRFDQAARGQQLEFGKSA